MAEVKVGKDLGSEERFSPIVPMRKKLAYSFNQLGINILWQAFNTVAVYFYVTQLKVPGVQISVVMIIYGVINAFFNFFAGHLSDRTQTRFGRRIPYIVFASFPFAAAFYFLFSPPPLGDSDLLIYFAILTFLFDLFFTFAALNSGALFPEMYPDEQERAFVSALQQVFSIIGMIAGVALAKSFGAAFGWHTMGLVFAGIGALTMYVSLYGSFENPAYREAPFQLKEAIKATFQNHRFVIYMAASFLIQFTTTLYMGASSFYTKYVIPLSALQNSLFLGLIFIVAMPVSFIWARLVVSFNTAKMVLVAVFLFMMVTAAFLFEQTPIQLLTQCIIMGIPISGFMVLMTVLLADVIDYDAKLTGKRREGMYLGINGFVVRLGMSLQYAVMAIFFQLSGYNANAAVQSSRTILGFRLLLGGVPLIFLLLAFLLLLKYKKEELN
jgi:GPH family glycoside/pentoside/hexuronide:cation symporter